MSAVCCLVFVCGRGAWYGEIRIMEVIGRRKTPNRSYDRQQTSPLFQPMPKKVKSNLQSVHVPFHSQSPFPISQEKLYISPTIYFNNNGLRFKVLNQFSGFSICKISII